MQQDSQPIPLRMDSEEFRSLGHALVDQLASWMKTMPYGKLTSAEGPEAIQNALGMKSLPDKGEKASDVVEEAFALLKDHSLFNGHPSFWGYISGSPAPIGILADFMASAINPNVGAFILSPMATEMERQSIQWLAELIDYPTDGSGIFVSGGNMANFVGFLAARKKHFPAEFRDLGNSGIPDSLSAARSEQGRFLVYCAKGTHTWIEKACELFGLGLSSIRWIDTDVHGRMDMVALTTQLTSDKLALNRPFLVVGNAGAVGNGIIDPLAELAAIAQKENMWFHVDGAYGAPAACLPELKTDFEGLSLADSVALDPHKWLYAPLEAGCILVKNKQDLHQAFYHNPDYYRFDTGEEERVNFHEYGMQNSRGFRALKVWMQLKNAGSQGYQQMIRRDIDLAQTFFQLLKTAPDFQAVSQNLSIVCFRYLPVELQGNEKALEALNEKLLFQIQHSKTAFLSNAVIHGKLCLRVCIVNFRTELRHLVDLMELVRELSHKEIE